MFRVGPRRMRGEVEAAPAAEAIVDQLLRERFGGARPVCKALAACRRALAGTRPRIGQGNGEAVTTLRCQRGRPVGANRPRRRRARVV